MPWPLRVQYPGAIYHLMSRGDHREPTFRDDIDRRTFLATLGAACDYVHLNPVRAGLIPADQPLTDYAWCSYPLYLWPGKRPPWLRVDRLLGAHGIQSDTAADRIHFQQRMEQRRREDEAPDQWDAFRRGWRLGAADFAQRLTERLGRPGQAHEEARERNETDEHRAERLVKEWMQTTGWTEGELAARAKGDAQKALLAVRLRRETPMTRTWIAQRLAMGSASYVSHLTKENPPRDRT